MENQENFDLLKKQIVSAETKMTKAKNILKLPAVILSLGFVIGVVIGSYVFYQVKSFDNAITVTGSAKKEVVSDQVKWVSTFMRTAKVSSLKAGYTQMASDLSAVKAFFADNGIAEADLNISPVFMEQIYDSGQMGKNVADRDYTLRQTVEINSGDVDKITGLSKNFQSIVDKGVVFSTQSLEYSYSKLPELRVSLLADALKDATDRANVLAKSSGKKIGSIKSASSGVVQVLSPNSVDVSDYGTYDTNSLKKEVMITVRAAFNVSFF